MAKWLAIAAGGALGSVLRFAAYAGMQRIAGHSSFPLGTFVVNVLGCLALGLLAGLFAAQPLVREEVRLGLTVGVLGGFTTFSTFGLESFQLLSAGYWRLMLANVVLSCLVGIAAVWLGYRAAERLLSP